MNGYLHVVAPRKSRASAALGVLTLVIPCCGTDKFSWSFLPSTSRLCNLLPSGVFSGGTWSSPNPFGNSGHS